MRNIKEYVKKLNNGRKSKLLFRSRLKRKIEEEKEEGQRIQKVIKTMNML